jgi:FdhD protein
MGQSVVSTTIHRVDHGSSCEAQDVVAVEEPLEIAVDGRSISITMRTPGNDEELATGFLVSEGILSDRTQVSEVTLLDDNRVNVVLASSAGLDLSRLDRHFYTSSSCGVCGKTSIQALDMVGCPVIPRDRPLLDPFSVCRMPEKLRSRQQVFDRTGGLHAAALFDSEGTLNDLREDVGRHNAVDKLIGAAFLKGHLPLNDRVLMLSGRASFELVQKAIMAGIGAIVAVGAPSSLAVQLAEQYAITLIGFARGERFNVYSGGFRLKMPCATAHPNENHVAENPSTKL